MAGPVQAGTCGDAAVSVIVVSFNTRALTLAAVESVFATTRAPCEVIVVDNASTDGSAEALAALANPAVRLIRMSRNTGFAAACNAAAEVARGRYLLLLNSDARCLPGAIDSLLAFAERHPRARIWGGRTLHSDGRLNPTSCWRRKTLWSVFCGATGLGALFRGSPLFNPESYPGWNRDSEREVDIVSGSFLLTERAFWQRLGGFDPVFFLYGEEADFCLRARALGAAPLVTPDATILHVEGASRQSPESQLAFLLAAHITLCRRHLPAGTRSAAVALIRAGVVARHGLHLALRRLGSPSGLRLDRWQKVSDRRAEWWNGYA